MSKPEISSHCSHDDWCHLCGKRSRRNADIWYPDNAEHDHACERYIRICRACALRIAETADEVAP
jgi:sulfatase maturation enzyme AslB (radical SAM superfamily)